MPTMKDHALIVFCAALLGSASAFTASQPPLLLVKASHHSNAGLFMQPINNNDFTSDDPSSTTLLRRQRRDSPPQQPLRAVKVGTLADSVDSSSSDGLSFFSDAKDDSNSSSNGISGLLQVLSAASLVTGSTVGASMLVLPSLAVGPGFAASSGLFLGMYMLVLTSGLIIADVAIHQHESGYDVPSSFQEFAEANLEGDGDNESSFGIAKCVSIIPVLVNSLVLIFDISKAGELGSSLLSPFLGAVDPVLAAVGFVSILGAALSSFSGEKLSAVASMCVTVLLVAFGGLLLPGLAAVQDPMGTLVAPGLDGDQWLASALAAAPIVLTALQFQNVVPSIAKILKYDRQKTVAAIALGSATPLAMYTAWCFAVLAGGMENIAGGAGGPLMTVFAAATLFGSSIGSSMGMAEEVETFVSKSNVDESSGTAETPKQGDVFSLPAVALSLAVPMAGVTALSITHGDASGALAIAGSFGSPILYGIIPAMMAMNQRKKAAGEAKPILVPGGLASIGALGLASAVYVGEGFASRVAEVLTVAPAVLSVAS